MTQLTPAEIVSELDRHIVGQTDAKRAVALLPNGSGPWQRAQDVLIASERFAKKRKR